MEALVAELGLQESIQIPGFIDNPYAYMSKAALFVLSSTSEGLPNVIIEALAVGAPSFQPTARAGRGKFWTTENTERLCLLGTPKHWPPRLRSSWRQATIKSF
jgi:glycosyltransferase involved in cell wall biosynthesis